MASPLADERTLVTRPFAKRLLRLAGWLLLEFCFLIVVAGFSVWADSSSRVTKPAVSGCYCGCAQAKTSAGCGKMCELPKYATRWWAVSCGKPRAKTQTDNPGAGPHFPHLPKAERASN